MDEIYKLNEASCLISVLDQAGVKESLSQKIRTISKVYVPKEHRKQGLATALLKKIGKEADEAQIALVLEPNSYDDGEMTQEQLIAFYKKLGFIELQKKPLLLARIPVPPFLMANLIKKKTANVIQDVYGRTIN